MVRYAQHAGRHDLLLGLNYATTHVDGGDYRNDAGMRAGLMDTVDQDATSLELYVLDRWQLADRLRLELGAQGVSADRDVVNVDAANGAVQASRGDFSRVNPRVGVIYNASRGVDLFANVSGLYEPPTNFELTDEATGGNKLLDAMKGTVVEVGTRATRNNGSGRQLRWEVAAYYARIQDEILSIEDPAAPGTSLSANIDRTTHAGIEAMVGADLPVGARGSVLAPRISATINDFSFDDDKYYGDGDLPSAPGYVLRGELLYRHPSGLFVGPTFDIVDSRYVDFTNTYRVDGYSLVGLRAGWSHERWRVFADLVNASDERYVATVGVRDVADADAAVLNPGQPRSVYFGIQGSF
jgi:iron complex outermembrane receptor protein